MKTDRFSEMGRAALRQWRGERGVRMTRLSSRQFPMLKTFAEAEVDDDNRHDQTWPWRQGKTEI